jgi:AmpE protein
MMWTVMAVVAALVIGHAMPQVSQWRNFGWFERWLDFLQQQIFSKPAWQGYAGLLLGIGLPALLLALTVGWLDGFFAFLVALAVMLYTWGPRDLDLDVNAVIHASGLDAKEDAAKSLYEEGQSVSLEGPVVVAAVFENALARWFAQPVRWRTVCCICRFITNTICRCRKTCRARHGKPLSPPIARPRT